MALAWGLAHLLGGRAAYIHVGTSIGTIMAANVFFVIIPGQRRMVERDGGRPGAEPARRQRAKQRSVHNNYFTLPVVFLMISNHYAATYSHPYAWAVLGLISGAGVSIRHFFNRRHKGHFAWPYLRPAGSSWESSPGGPRRTSAAAAGRRAGDLRPRALDRGPALRHLPLAGPHVPGDHPAAGRSAAHAPAGIVQNAQRIYQQVVVTRIMPLGNATKITDQERAVIAAWVAAGAPAQ